MTTSKVKPVSPASAGFTVDEHVAIRAQFPILDSRPYGLPLIYLDNGASTHQPLAVIKSVDDYVQHHHANIHRGSYLLSQESTEAYEHARAQVAQFIGARNQAECIFTSGTTDAINLLANTWGVANLKAGDEILLSQFEHHSNIVPWQLVAERTGAKIQVVPLTPAGELDMDAFHELLSQRTKIVAITYISNALGTINPVTEIITAAHAHGALVMLDCAQAIAHCPINVVELDVDFLAFSGHKVYGSTGIGVLYGKHHLLEQMPPWKGGGDMIEQVTFARTTYAPPPQRFEAGTMPIASAVGLGAALTWLAAQDLHKAAAHENKLVSYATQRLQEVPGLEIFGQARNLGPIRSFLLRNPQVSQLDVGTQLDLKGICVRVGHHCCQPLMESLGITGTVRASFAIHNRLADIDALADALQEIVAVEKRHQQEQQKSATAALQPSATKEEIYPDAAGVSPQVVAAEIKELFEFLPDWPMRHQEIIDFGTKLLPFPDAERTLDHYVHGCQSAVYMIKRIRPGTTDIVEFLADSDADIVRGLIAILQKLFSGQTAGAIYNFDTDAYFSEIGLSAHLSLTRRNGLASMIAQLKDFAARHLPNQ